MVKIIAVGNSFYGDDGVGAAVLEKIRQDGLFLGAELIDVHTDALALLEHLADGQKNVIVDAAQMGLEPGAVVGFRPEEVRMKIKSDHLSMHGFGLAEAFALAGQLNKMPADVLVVGVEPERVAINQGLSSVVKEAVPRVISIIQAEVESDG
jgi:hydrogenase maturation protease